MRHHVWDTLRLHHASTHFHGNVVPLSNGEIGVDVEMHVHENRIVGLARTQVVHIKRAPCRNQLCADRLRTSSASAARSIKSCNASQLNVAPIFTIIPPTINAATGSSRGEPRVADDAAGDHQSGYSSFWIADPGIPPPTTSRIAASASDAPVSKR